MKQIRKIYFLVNTNRKCTFAPRFNRRKWQNTKGSKGNNFFVVSLDNEVRFLVSLHPALIEGARGWRSERLRKINFQESLASRENLFIFATPNETTLGKAAQKEAKRSLHMVPLEERGAYVL